MMVYLFPSSLEEKFALHIKWEWPGDEAIHRRRKILKVAWGAEYPIVCEACTNFYDHAYFVSNHAHFCTIEAAITSFSKNRTVGQVE